MTHDLLLKNIARHIQLTAAETQHFTSLLSYKELPKKTLLLQEGQPCKQLSYVHAGALRAYHTDKEGKESTIMFAVADWWVTDMYCFLNAKPAMMYIETLESSSIFQLSKERLDQLYTDIPKFERFFRILMQNAYTREQLRVIENLSLSAKERYESFLLKYPHIAQIVTQKQIASYLGITPEFLSAVRKAR
ncbi:Crp/Fnr family transcriptional regulator [Deminuibacter soli]|uniref:Crp/Fnr family transcriptional regulator n=1 Tax=Deminuibacter soli TaxID=2291815 RepID=A0A3E1NHV8_9BACT|nr:Crp/Fnr family transcriptional regulator [Deminuibacter soli]RFM27507.1 Crp/Fnr family transcriptional regulator [Deminuibacter soli]